jgi:hypothetical protein
VSLDYSADPGCADTTAFQELVIAHLGYDPFSDGAPDHVTVRFVRRQNGSVDGRIEWRDPSGKWAGDQMFPSSTDCRHLVRAVSFALAVQIQFLAIMAPSPEPPPPPRPAPPPPAPVAMLAPPAPPTMRVVGVALAGGAPSPAARPLFALGAGSSVGFGLSSAPVVLGRITGNAAWPHASAEVDVELGLPTSTRRADGAGVSQQQLLIGAAGCGVLGRASACLLAKAGETRMRGENIDAPSSAVGAIVQAGLRAGATQGLGRRAFLAVHADGLVNVTRWTVRLDQVPVWSAPRFAATVGADLGMRFP